MSDPLPTHSSDERSRASNENQPASSYEALREDTYENLLSHSAAGGDPRRLLPDLTAEQLLQLQRVFGREKCRRWGLYLLPESFRLSVIVPVYNEVKTVEQVVDRLQNTGLPLEIILVDDGSTDGTRQELERLAAERQLRLLLHERNQGKGAAIRTGLLDATGDVVVIQDADMEYDPADFWWLLQPLVEDRADVVYGSRFATTDRPVSPLWHQWGNQFITLCTNVALGLRFTDVETCYKMFRRALVLDVIRELREKRFGIEIELTCRLAKRHDLRFYEIPIRYERRTYAEGKKIGWKDGVAALWCILRYALLRSRNAPAENKQPKEL